MRPSHDRRVKGSKVFLELVKSQNVPLAKKKWAKAKLHSFGVFEKRQNWGMPKPMNFSINNLLSRPVNATTCISATFGAFGLGLGLSWTSPTLPVLSECGDDCAFDKDFGKEVGSWIGAIFPIGALVSSFATGIMMAKIGRKWTMIAMAAPFIAGWICLTIPIPLDIDTPWIYYAGRFLTGNIPVTRFANSQGFTNVFFNQDWEVVLSPWLPLSTSLRWPRQTSGEPLVPSCSSS